MVIMRMVIITILSTLGKVVHNILSAAFCLPSVCRLQYQQLQIVTVPCPGPQIIWTVAQPPSCPGFLTNGTSAHRGRVCMQVSSCNRDGVGRGCVPRDGDCRGYFRASAQQSPCCLYGTFLRRGSGTGNPLLAEQVLVLQHLCW